ncbi:transmembrane protein 164 [Scaptodrosophila lebanonensis]|uniref:Transmembrane protein 164 n=1 Tax=Drosophila lebanonensis TaxID=7225 RepID=A0A6J2UEV7_DROLE|nr:transmembrane protein 164 [Scaptodrosophila lebanonensis]XP_030385956.1 transmembrane protein 164 [Scaptodrosophila lebanonensis]XP_030385964.1 transmembrane protein 164 [Scaptodrosophila lebanonensis]XP_030385972.1 transmembrane protein 164 [Scaptodrosophila lebanonensis]XP_030385979.1 transmembrane protein 164 [Scaptodrosophila lebanonensis]
MDWDWAVGGITDEIPRTTGPECINYMTNRRRWMEAVFLSALFVYIMYRSWKKLAPIRLPEPHELERPHTATRLLLLIFMTGIFGIEMGFKLAGRSMIFALNPCHVQTCVQIYLLAAKPSKVTTALFRIQMNNLNGPFLAFLFPEVEGRTYPLEQATYWIQHALLYIIPIYILKTGTYSIETIGDFQWVKIGTALMLFYHFSLLNALSIVTGINLDHMLCAALSDPFQGQNYRLFACCHEALLCPLLNKGTVLLFSPRSLSTISRGNCFSNVSNTNMTTKEVQRNFDTKPVTEVTLYDQLTSQKNATREEANESLPRQRYNMQTTTSHHTLSDSVAGTRTAEYSMPTTKID